MIPKQRGKFMEDYFKLPPLPYNFNELEPYVSANIMEVHYSKHHAGYVKKLNESLKQFNELENKHNLTSMIQKSYELQFNGGGHINHTLLWENLIGKKNGGGEIKEGPLLKLIEEQFQSLDSFIATFSAKASAIKGSGWAFLGYNDTSKKLDIITTLNHGLCNESGCIPLLCIDVWEHAYYLQYKNDRAQYLKNIWNIINWNCAETRLTTI